MPKTSPQANLPYTTQGKWWRPGDSSNRVSGTLSYKPGKQASLSLDGTFGTETLPLFSPPPKESLPMIYGETPDGYLITLFDTFRTNTLTGSSGYPTTEY